jgi:hypothetical protein
VPRTRWSSACDGSRLDENIEAVAVELTPDDLGEIESAAAKITVHGHGARTSGANDQPLKRTTKTGRRDV